MTVPENEEEAIFKNTIEKEHQRVLQLVRSIGPKLSGLMIVSGLLVLVFGIYICVAPQDALLSPRLTVIFIGALSFLGGLNILCGLLLLLGEE